jgi:uncharacterized metal-binding protein
VGGIADQSARRLTGEGIGRMFCLAGIGGRVSGIMATARAADRILAIDGCPQECSRHCPEEAGFSGFLHLRLRDLGPRKGESPVSDVSLHRVTVEARRLLLGPAPSPRGAGTP